MALDFNSFLSNAIGIFQSFQGASVAESAASAAADNIRIGGQIEATGYRFTAAGYRESAKAVQGAFIFNEEVAELNHFRQLVSVSRNFQRTAGRQIVQQAASGINLNSKSFLMTRNETLDAFTRLAINTKVDYENRKRATRFSTQVTLNNLENAARASDYQAEAAIVRANNEAAFTKYQGKIASYKAGLSAAQGFSSLLSGLGK